jgi:hypothetical protein
MYRVASASFVVALVNAYSQTLSDCNAFAAKWDNTCTGGALANGA